MPERELVHVAVRSLGLAELTPFDPEQKVIEYRIRDRRGSLVEMTARGPSPTNCPPIRPPREAEAWPRSAALSAGPSAPWWRTSPSGKKGLEEAWDPMKAAARRGQELKDWFLAAVDEDTAAFNRVMDALRLPGKVARGGRGQGAGGTRGDPTGDRGSPLGAGAVARGPRSWRRRRRGGGTRTPPPDAGVAALCARTCAEGAWLNVRINLKNLTDAAWVEETRLKAATLRREAVARAEAILAEVEKKIGG